jgi:toxin FitB
MGSSYLIDTNIIIYTLHGVLPQHVKNFLSSIPNADCSISIITRIEVLGFAFQSPEDETTAQSFLQALNTWPLSDDIADKAIEIRKAQKIKLGDALIAATALVFDLTLITRNEGDFQNIPNLKYINPWSI